MRARLAALSLVLMLPAGSTETSPEPVALIYSMEGDGGSQVVPTGDAGMALDLFSWLREGTNVVVSDHGRVLIAYVGGSRFELGPGASATIGPNGLTKATGKVKSLPATPPFPTLPRVAAGLGAQPAGGAAAEVDPARRTARVLADTAVLEWPPVKGAKRYQVTIDAEDGRNIYQSEATTSSLRVPSSLLKPGARYSWRVSPISESGKKQRPVAVLQVLPAEVAESRKAFQAFLRREGGSDAIALLSEVDRSLGLFVEANRELTEAIALLPVERRATSPLGRIQLRKGLPPPDVPPIGD